MSTTGHGRAQRGREKVRPLRPRVHNAAGSFLRRCPSIAWSRAAPIVW